MSCYCPISACVCGIAISFLACRPKRNFRYVSTAFYLSYSPPPCCILSLPPPFPSPLLYSFSPSSLPLPPAVFFLSLLPSPPPCCILSLPPPFPSPLLYYFSPSSLPLPPAVFFLSLLPSPPPCCIISLPPPFPSPLLYYFSPSSLPLPPAVFFLSLLPSPPPCCILSLPPPPTLPNRPPGFCCSSPWEDGCYLSLVLDSLTTTLNCQSKLDLYHYSGTFDKGPSEIGTTHLLWHHANNLVSLVQRFHCNTYSLASLTKAQHLQQVLMPRFCTICCQVRLARKPV